MLGLGLVGVVSQAAIIEFVQIGDCAFGGFGLKKEVKEALDPLEQAARSRVSPKSV